MWELDCEESWELKNWWFWSVVLEKTIESPLDCKEIQPDHPEGDQPWDFFGRNDAKAEAPVLWPPHAKGWLIGKDSDAGRDWGQEKEESEKVGLKLNIQKTKIMASGPITSWEIDGETVETVSDFIFWALKSLQMVTAAMKLKGAYSLEEKLWRS